MPAFLPALLLCAATVSSSVPVSATESAQGKPTTWKRSVNAKSPVATAEPPPTAELPGDAPPASVSAPREPLGLGVRAQVGVGPGTGTFAAFAGGAHYWLGDYVGLGLRYNAMREVDIALDARRKTAHTGTALLMLRSRPRGHHGFLTMGGGWGRWRSEDPDYRLPIEKSRQYLGLGNSVPEPPRYGDTSHLSIDAGYSWQLAAFEVGPIARADVFFLERDRWCVTFGASLGIAL